MILEGTPRIRQVLLAHNAVVQNFDMHLQRLTIHWRENRGAAASKTEKGWFKRFRNRRCERRSFHKAALKRRQITGIIPE